MRKPSIHVLVHLEGEGDRIVADDAFAGASSPGIRVEGFQLDLVPPVPGLGLRYWAHLQDLGDSRPVTEGRFVGTRGQAARLEGFQIELTGPLADRYDLSYMARVQEVGDTPWTPAGAFCGTRGQSRRLEGLAIRLVAKAPEVILTAQVEGQGETHAREGDLAGAKGHRLEGFQLDLVPATPGLGLRYSGHAEGAGELPPVADGHFLGARGRPLRLESVRLELTGDAKDAYELRWGALLDGASEPTLAGSGATLGGPGRRVEGILVTLAPRAHGRPLPGAAPRLEPAEPTLLPGLRAGEAVHLRSYHGRRLAATAGGLVHAAGLPDAPEPAPAARNALMGGRPGRRSEPAASERFTLVRAGDPGHRGPLRYGDRVALVAAHGRPVTPTPAGGLTSTERDAAEGWVVLDPRAPGSRETIEPFDLVALRSAAGRYLTGEPDGDVHVTKDAAGPSERWTVEPAAPELGVALPPPEGSPLRPPAVPVVEGFERDLGTPGTLLHSLLDAGLREQGDASEAMDGRKVPVVLAVVTDRSGGTTSGIVVRLVQGGSVVDQARTDAGGLAVLRFPGHAQDVRGGLAIVEVPDGATAATTQVIFEVPARRQHAIVRAVLDQLPEASSEPVEAPYHRLPLDHTPELHEDFARLHSPPSLFGAEGAGDLRLGRGRIVKRVTVARVGERTGAEPAPRYLVRLRQEWVFMGYTLGPLQGIEDLAPGQRLSETTQTLERASSRTARQTLEAFAEARRMAESATSQTTDATSSVLGLASTDTQSSFHSRAEVENTSWAVGGFLGIIGGGGGGSKTTTDVSTEAKASLRSSALMQTSSHASVEANSLLRAAQTEVNRQAQSLASLARDTQSSVMRSLDKVSPLLSRTTNLMRWTIYENYAVVTRVEDVKEVKTVKMAQPAEVGGTLFRDEDIVEYARHFAPALLDRTLLRRFDVMRQAVETKRNANRPITHVRVSVDYATQGASGELKVTINGHSAHLPLRRDGRRAEGILVLPAPVPAAQVQEATLRLSLGSDVDAGGLAAFGSLPAHLFGTGEQRDAFARHLAAAAGRVSVSSVTFDYSSAQGAPLAQTQRLGETFAATMLQPAAEASVGLSVPRPAVDTENDPLFVHVNRNRTYYMGVLLEAALANPSLRDDVPQLSSFRSDHDVWRLPILGFEGDRLLVLRDVDPSVPYVKRLLTDPGAATMVQVASPGAYSEAVQGALELVDLKGKLPPSLERAVQVVPPGYHVLEAPGAAAGNATSAAPGGAATPGGTPGVPTPPAPGAPGAPGGLPASPLGPLAPLPGAQGLAKAAEALRPLTPLILPFA